MNRLVWSPDELIMIFGRFPPGISSASWLSRLLQLTKPTSLVFSPETVSWARVSQLGRLGGRLSQLSAVSEPV
jgi:hypothetical protein